MAVPSAVLRLHAPLAARERMRKCIAKLLQARGTERRTIDQRDHRSVVSSCDEFIQSNLQTTELAALRSGVLHHDCSVPCGEWCKLRCIRTGNHDDRFRKGQECCNRSSEQSLIVI